MKIFLSLVGLMAVLPATQAGFNIAKNGRVDCLIILQEGATDVETNAVKELVHSLREITGSKFILNETVRDSDRVIIVGPGALAEKYFPEIDLAKFGPEELVMKVKGNKLLLAGGRPRGTMYAVNRFLQEQCGVRWWTPWATNIPHQATLKVGDLDMKEKPAFEYRGPYWYPGFEQHWKVHNEVNNENWEIPKELGGCIRYAGFCHTFYPLVPPEKYFKDHPEWYSLVKGQRTHDRAQLCLTNPKLRDFMVEQVKARLRSDPGAKIISVTQNDNDGWCECPDCKAMDDAEGSHAGTMIDFVNYIAEKIEPEFPNIWVDTFAYQYTRHPPKTVRPRPNVIVRLCSIECNFREPLDHLSNADFLADLTAWSRICQHLYIWDYTTDFSHYIFPHPNWFELGANIRIFQRFGVKGVFSEGAYAGPGSEMAELRAWVLAQLMWNPQQDDRALIREFIEGYYGQAAAKPILEYLELFQQESKGYFLGCYLRKDPPYMQFKPLARAELLWQEAERVSAGDAEKLRRVRMAHLPVRFAWLASWRLLRAACREQNGSWPLANSRKAVADEFAAVCAGLPGKDWTQVNVLNERGLTVADFLKKFAQDTPELDQPLPPKRLAKPKIPADLSPAQWKECVDIQDNLANIYKPGEFAEIKFDPAASDFRACWMPGTHREWAFRIAGKSLPFQAQSGQWQIYVVARIETEPGATDDGGAFEAGVWDNDGHASLASCAPKVKDIKNGYHSILVGAVETGPDRDIWVAPSGNKVVKAIYVDRVFLKPVP